MKARRHLRKEKEWRTVKVIEFGTKQVLTVYYENKRQRRLVDSLSLIERSSVKGHCDEKVNC
ncbi:MAG: hypothetical protein ACRC4Q_00595, partial [Paraclostridium dentum]